MAKYTVNVDRITAERAVPFLEFSTTTVGGAHLQFERARAQSWRGGQGVRLLDDNTGYMVRVSLAGRASVRCILVDPQPQIASAIFRAIVEGIGAVDSGAFGISDPDHAQHFEELKARCLVAA